MIIIMIMIIMIVFIIIIDSSGIAVWSALAHLCRYNSSPTNRENSYHDDDSYDDDFYGDCVDGDTL